MSETLKLSPLIRAAGLSLILSIAAAAQLPPGLELVSFPAGLQPLGMDIVYPPQGQAYAVVANSGENSVSILNVSVGAQNVITIDPLTKVTGIPSPYGVAACPLVGQYALVTSPSDNSVRVLQVPQGTVLGTLKVGPQPYSVACIADPATGHNQLKGLVSNAGDNSLTVIDVAALTVTATIPNVPASRGFHGIATVRDVPSSKALVAGNDANVVTLVDLSSFNVLVQIPVDGPTAAAGGDPLIVASAGDNEILVFSYPNYTLTSTFPNVLNPQDLLSVNGSLFAILGGQDSLASWGTLSSSAMPSIIPGVPGATALAAAYFEVGGGGGSIIKTPLAAVLVTSSSTNSVFLIRSQQPPPSPPTDFVWLNGASLLAWPAPGSLATALVSTGVSQISRASPSLPPPTTLGGVTLSIAGSVNFDTSSSNWVYSSAGSVQAPLFFVGPNQINFQIPPGIAPAISIPAQLTKPDGGTLLTVLSIVATQPGIFSLLQNGQGQGAVQNQDFSQNGDPQSILGAKPAARGSMIIIYATGAGDTTPPLLPGQAADPSGNPLVLTNVQPTVTVGGVQAQVLFSGMTPGLVGLWQINAVVPQSVTPGSAVSLVISAGGATSNTVTIAVQ